MVTLVIWGAAIGGLGDATALPCTTQHGNSPTPTGWAQAFLGLLGPLAVLVLASVPGLVR